MAKYKISLLTSVANGNASYFLPTVLGIYNDQISYDKEKQETYSKILSTAHSNSEQSFCYTYNEKLSIHQNAQKDLSFFMDRKILLHDEWMVNPHIAAVHVGSLIELVDKYNQTYLFIVKKITYSFKEHNITYNYSCQDAFSYQYTRQQSGYTIENDAASEDFIGPKTIDWWVIKKIVPECYIEYEYIPMTVGLYQDNNGIHRFTIEEREKWTALPNNPKIIIKEPFIDDEYQTTFAFSCSGSNANAALIALGENLDLMLHTYEQKRPKQHNYYHYFWYEPKQNQDVSGLKYSPKSQISSFDLSFAGDSLTTVLNVNSHDVGEDLITLIPQTPALFTNYFMTNDWLNSKFKPGYFNSLISGKFYKNLYSTFEQEDNTINIEACSEVKTFKNINTDFESSNENDNKFLAIRLFDIGSENHTLTLPILYNLFADNWQQLNYTTFEYTIGTADPYLFNGNHNHMYLIIKNPNEDNYYIIHEDTEIPEILLGRPLEEVYLAIRTNMTGLVNITNINLFLNFYRNFTEEEKEFADIADQCPWLENRLIDFSYFLQQRIISKQEYETLMNKLQNDLRIVNGKLLFLSDSYFRALRTKTKELSDLTNNLDALSAEFHANVVDPLTEGKTIKDLNGFLNSYNSIFKLKTNTQQLLDYTNVLSDYFEKYLNSEQRFLKNIYAFRKYFNEPCTFSYNTDAGIYIDTISTSISDLNEYFISFGTPSFSCQDLENHKNNQWFYRDHDKYIVSNFITNINSTQYYKPSIQIDRLISLSKMGANNNNIYDFSKNASYYLTQSDYNKYFGSIARAQDSIQTYTNNGITYYKLSSTELKRLVINEHKKDYYLRNQETYINLDNVRSTYNLISNTISWITLPNLMSYWNYTEVNEKSNIVDWGWNIEKKKGITFFWNYYKSFFPVDTIYYKGPVIKTFSATKTIEVKGVNKDFTNWTIQRFNELNKPDTATNYETYQPINFAGNGLVLKDWGNCSSDTAVDAKQKLQSTWNYASFNYAPSAGQTVATVASFLLAPTVPFLGLALACFSSYYHKFYTENYCKWQTNTNAYRSFEGKDDTYHQINKDGGNAIMNPVLDNINYYNYDSYYANYATSIDASSQHMLQTALFYRIFDDKYKPLVKSYEPQITWYENYGDWNNISFNTNINTNQQYNLYQYFNFYKYIVPTYSFRLGYSADASLFIKNKYFRVLGANDKLNAIDSYLRIPVYEDYNNSTILSDLTIDTEAKKTLSEHTKMIYIKTPNYFQDSKVYSTLRWYPLYNIGTDLNLQSFDIWKNHNSYSLQELLQLITKNVDSSKLNSQINNKIITFQSKDSNNPTCAQYLYVHIEDYVRDVFDEANRDKTEEDYNGQSLYSTLGNLVYAIDINDNKAVPTLNKIYSVVDDTTVNPLDRAQALKFESVDLYMIADQDADMVRIEQNDDINKLRCYQLDSELGEFKRIYTQQQIIDALEADTDYCDKTTAQKFYYINATSLQVTNFMPHTKEFITNLYLCHLIKNDDVYKIIATPYYGKDILDFSDREYDDLGVLQKDFVLYDAQGIQYKSTIIVNEVKQESLSNISNGTFWYRYHTRLDIPTLFEYAASIETQLQTYWDQAYTASKYCKYFLPKSWQPQTGDTINAFAKNIIIAKVNIDDQTIIDNVTLSNEYLPEVEIYVNDTFETFKYKHYLTKFTWRYNPTNNYTWTQMSENEDIIQQQTDNYVKASSVPILQNNKAVLDIMTHLNTKLSDWEVIDNGYTVYYYQIGEKSGMLWKELAFNINNSSIFEHFDGLYGMMYYLLSQNYIDCIIQEYEKIKQQKANIWNQIYTEYPFLMLEDNYSYSLATTSSELLKMAQLIFKGKKQPEKNYNIAIIDTYSLIDYHGQELKPGQGIQINANDYYDENDDIYNALSQYLFITDVSYDLRKDMNVNITVNNIKYQEKLLQSLVKLIR